LVSPETAGHFLSAQLVHKSPQNQLISSVMEDAGLKYKGFNSVRVTVQRTLPTDGEDVRI
jgi:hypothetical protein